jgi:phage host-nuclease inhibitor protein Gam
MNIFTYAVVAIDGIKFKAVNNKHNNYTPNKVNDHIRRIEKHIENDLSRLETADANDKIDAVQASAAEKIAWIKQRVAELKELAVQVEAHPNK